MVAAVTVKAYASPSCVLLTFDWKDGAEHEDFLGFAIQRNPGYGRDRKPQFLFNKLDFVPLAEDARPKGSDKAPIQKFNWWDGGINLDDQGQTFEYTVIPVLGTSPGDLQLQDAAAGKRTVTVPRPLEGQIATYFNRAVVSAQSFAKQKDKPLEKRMDGWPTACKTPFLKSSARATHLNAPSIICRTTGGSSRLSRPSKGAARSSISRKLTTPSPAPPRIGSRRHDPTSRSISGMPYPS
ncbi:hypothetical protein I6F21_08650 [Bradyrhizobium sp. NBAIM03]|nr:hypothetical protein [Bradyrhizobium sp. BRP05]MCA1394403.1 hypothetical protein [Bradyrhizobium sp. IC3123]MCA1423935.1 hypothetical protein [Bradyrhizobium sp. BRP23]MCA1430953.1 hypothetical protein [Bradyrhizobium sp. NBAIM16]MCA1438260.1 hypothetical protein [Bradyrhizobium sp. BRP20]MCA1480513.1 hypothetical protein [Bradyrhizobium sp. NBAIM08]MCA1501893.1 hypothetical protein [Bradyrhizobium sp. NBAIM14]MCA1509143.1 hypothetical protein [Bradyrhizobium sp. NBAIM02]MCA1532619.1 hyp